jgi:hypothetical protein
MNPTHQPIHEETVRKIILSQHTTVQHPQNCARYVLSICSTSNNEERLSKLNSSYASQSFLANIPTSPQHYEA